MTKKNFFAMLVAVLMASSSLFAQVSNMSHSTAGQFTNDIDCLMDINDWDLMMLEKMFGYIGYDDDCFELGAAWKIESLFAGLYLSGFLPGKTVKYDSNDNKTEVTTDDSSFTTSAMFAFSNIAIKYTFKRGSDSKNDWSDIEGGGWQGRKYSNMTNGLDFGMKIKREKVTLKPYAMFSLYTVKDETGKDGAYDYSNNVNKLSLTCGSKFAFKRRGNVMNTMNLKLGGDWSFFPDVAYESADGVKRTQDGRYNNTAMFTAGYTLTVFPNEKTMIKVNARFPLSVNFVDDKVENFAKAINTALRPYLAAAMNCNIRENFALNVGALFSMPSFLWEHKWGESSAYTFKTGNMSLKWYSGFTWKIGKYLMVDASLDILGNLFDNLSSDFDESSDDKDSSDALLDNINDLLFSNFSIKAAIKF